MRLQDYGWRRGRDGLWRHDAFGGSFNRGNAIQVTNDARRLDYRHIRFPVTVHANATRALKRYMENPTKFLQPGEYVVRPPKRKRTGKLILDAPEDGSPAGYLIEPLRDPSGSAELTGDQTNRPVVMRPENELYLDGKPTGITVTSIVTDEDLLNDDFELVLGKEYRYRTGPKSYTLHLEFPR